MKFSTILVATDFSECSDAALNYATSLARDNKADLIIVHVDEAGQFVDTGYAGWPTHSTDDSTQKQLNETVPNDPNVRYNRFMLSGVPAQEITAFAESQKADLIVVGTHGRRGISHALLGSVAEKIVRTASCPVLTISNACRQEAVET